MIFQKITSNEVVVNYLVNALNSRLKSRQKVLWLVSGGSAIDIEVAVSRKLETGDLSVALIDERYGPPGHQDSNYAQLIQKGFKAKNFVPILGTKDPAQTEKDWEEKVKELFNEADFVLAVAGLGADGHTFGIKPDSPAVSTTTLVCGYAWNDYTRLTLTAEAIKRIDKIVVYALGQEKATQLGDLKRDLPVSQQPAQALKLCSDLIIFNDQLE